MSPDSLSPNSGPDPSGSPERILTELAARYYGTLPSDASVHPIARGASGRTIIRITPSGTYHSCIGIHWTNARADNNSFIPAARFLKQGGVRVPQLLSICETAPGCGAALVEDLGDTNLLELRTAPYDLKQNAYRSAMEQLHRLHTLSAPDSLVLQPPFDASLYRWEQEYFAEHVVAALCGQDAGAFLEDPALSRLSRKLAAQPRCLIHRDFQSQNIHLLRREAWLIDFQGMRYGLAEYDLASLVYDPYMALSSDERKTLLVLWEQISSHPLDRDILNQCALQRIMQASAAFARYGMAGSHWYANQLKPALDILKELSLSSPLEHLLVPVIRSAYDHMPLC